MSKYTKASGWAFGVFYGACCTICRRTSILIRPSHRLHRRQDDHRRVRDSVRKAVAEKNVSNGGSLHALCSSTSDDAYWPLSSTRYRSRAW